MEFIISIILCGLVSLLSFIYYKKKNKENFKKTREEIYQKEKEKIVVQVQAELKDLNDKKIALEEEIQKKLSFNESMRELREEELDRLIEAKKEEKIILLNQQAEDYYNEQIESKKKLLDSFHTLQEQEMRQSEEELQIILTQLEEYRSARESINKAILKEREIQEKEDFYKILITESDKEDIQYLISIVNNFNKKETIYKLIWSEYLQKAFKLMVNRVLQGRDPRNVIYMIENIKTKEKYIGKTQAEVSKRWTEHIKSSLNIGTISNTLVHKALFNSWDNFAFTILEEVPKDQNLGEREKYYIKFYQSNVVGYNIKSGG